MSEPDTPDEAQLAELIDWRFSELERHGCTSPYAGALAVADSVDLHQACDLLDRGCPPRLVAAILI